MFQNRPFDLTDPGGCCVIELHGISPMRLMLWVIAAATFFWCSVYISNILIASAALVLAARFKMSSGCSCIQAINAGVCAVSSQPGYLVSILISSRTSLTLDET